MLMGALMTVLVSASSLILGILIGIILLHVNCQYFILKIIANIHNYNKRNT